jgi:hypothetical protein
MGLFDDAGKGDSKASDFLKSVGAKARELGRKGVLRMEISQYESHLDRLRSSLGEAAFAAIVDGRPLDSADPEICKLVDDMKTLKGKIQAKREEAEKVGKD